MSHRITTQSNIKNPEVLGQVLKDKGIQYTEARGVFRITSGSLRQASIDTNTGVITGDSDYHGGQGWTIRQDYAEALLRNECIIQGVEIEERSEATIDGQACIRIITTQMSYG